MAKTSSFDHLIITCAVEKIDYRLLNQVRFNGTCIVPIGSILKGQRLKKIQSKIIEKMIFGKILVKSILFH